MNVWFLSSWDGSNAFADLMKHGGNWNHVEDGEQPAVPMDEKGWPLSDFRVKLFEGAAVRGVDFNGTYKLSFTGQTDIIRGLWSDLAITNKVYDEATNTTTCDATYSGLHDGSNGGVVFEGTRKTPQSPLNSGISNMKMFRPGYPGDGSQMFTTPFLNAIKAAGVIRTMDWMGIGGNANINWSERTPPDNPAVTRLTEPYTTTSDGLVYTNLNSGMSIEHIVRLCNEADSDLWINIPTLANDDYVRKMAQAIRFGTDGVNPYTTKVNAPVYKPLKDGLNVWVEYSNEIWNNFGGTEGGFRAFYFIQDEVRKIAATQPNHPLFYTGKGRNPVPNDEIYDLLYKYPAWRLGSISKLFREVFGDSNMMTRVRPILATQQGDANATLSRCLTWAEQYYKDFESHDLTYYYYGIGGSAYYGVNEGYKSINPDVFFNPAAYPDEVFKKMNLIDSTWAHTYGLKRVAYEGGPSLDSIEKTMNEFTDIQMHALNEDPRMQDLVEKNHDLWDQTGGDTLVYYCVAGASRWEFLRFITDTTSPKMKALKNLKSRGKAKVTAGAPLPGTISIAKYHGPEVRNIETAGGYFTGEGDQMVYNGIDARTVEEYFTLVGHSDAPFTGTITVKGERFYMDHPDYPHGTTRIAIYINGKKQGTVGISDTGGITESDSLAVEIPAGFVAVRVQVEEGWMSLHSATIK
ncbi:MAG: hypothetical protein A2015_11060 [Spirochaetes bacterium GWF1_31_7]|nr:MAG: hypothetical protein A2Y30_02295 [Spirochaetes bacterium GWE1_32_154]OHD46383.1 MAG: hypothetical protein A2Y29_04155 [Spirochaetes bacterium GWE2_31_10]OHD47791.1 MAG: hypothetical protein A2015_11060 [Spirochaetes bacterium GWF1_31_7]